MESRKNYQAPFAQIALFVPREEVSAFFGNNPWWKDNSAWWGAKYTGNASVVTGTLGIQDEDGNSWSFDSPMNQSN